MKNINYEVIITSIQGLVRKTLYFLFDGILTSRHFTTSPLQNILGIIIKVKIIIACT